MGTRLSQERVVKWNKTDTVVYVRQTMRPTNIKPKTDTGSGARSTYNRTTSQGLLTATGFNSTTTDCLLTRAVYRI